MRNRISKKQGRHRKGIGKQQLDNIRLSREVREIEAELKARGIDLSKVNLKEVQLQKPEVLGTCVPECTWLETRQHEPGCQT